MRFTVAIITLLCFYSCTKDVAGPTTEQGNPQICAVILDSLNNPIPNIPTTLLVIPPDDTTDDDDSLKKFLPPANAIKISTSKTSRDGKCSFFNLASGSYRIVATDSTLNLSVTSENITINRHIDTSLIDTLVLQKSSRIQGVVIRNQAFINNNLKNGFIQIRIFGLDRYSFTATSGFYSFDSLPYGMYTLYYYSPDFFVAHVDSIVVVPGKTTTIDTVSLEPYLQPAPANFQARYDTSTGVVHFLWSPINHPDHKYYEIQRECFENADLDKKLRTTETQISDSLLLIPNKTVFTYVIYSINQKLEKGSHSTPVEIMVSQ